MGIWDFSFDEHRHQILNFAVINADRHRAHLFIVANNNDFLAHIQNRRSSYVGLAGLINNNDVIFRLGRINSIHYAGYRHNPCRNCRLTLYHQLARLFAESRRILPGAFANFGHRHLPAVEDLAHLRIPVNSILQVQPCLRAGQFFGFLPELGGQIRHLLFRIPQGGVDDFIHQHRQLMNLPCLYDILRYRSVSVLTRPIADTVRPRRRAFADFVQQQRALALHLLFFLNCRQLIERCLILLCRFRFNRHLQISAYHRITAIFQQLQRIFPAMRKRIQRVDQMEQVHSRAHQIRNMTERGSSFLIRHHCQAMDWLDQRVPQSRLGCQITQINSAFSIPIDPEFNGLKLLMANALRFIAEVCKAPRSMCRNQAVPQQTQPLAQRLHLKKCRYPLHIIKGCRRFVSNRHCIQRIFLLLRHKQTFLDLPMLLRICQKFRERRREGFISTCKNLDGLCQLPLQHRLRFRVRFIN